MKLAFVRSIAVVAVDTGRLPNHEHARRGDNVEARFRCDGRDESKIDPLHR